MFRIAEQVIGLNPDTNNVVSAQRWTGFTGDREAFVLTTNDRVTTQRAGTPHATQEIYQAARARISQWSISEDAARDELERRGLARQRQCADPGCAAKLPLGGLYCPLCNRNHAT